jgi:uracil-DNA glycosylase
MRIIQLVLALGGVALFLTMGHSDPSVSIGTSEGQWHVALGFGLFALAAVVPYLPQYLKPNK